jgi:hypothetical protein
MRILKNIIKLVAASITVLSLQSCATIAGDNTRTVCVNSQPQGAGIYVDGQRRGTTPANIVLPSYIYGGKFLALKKEGYHEQATVINTKFQPCGLWNLLFWPGFLIDAATGDTVKIDPSQLNVVMDLQPIEQAPSK